MMDQPFDQKEYYSLKNPRFLSWILVAAAVFSCLARADFNVLGGLVMVLLLSSQAKFSEKTATKGSLQICIVLIICDLLWIIISAKYWVHEDTHSALWRSLSFIHNLVYFIGLLEFFLKFYIGFLLYKSMKNLQMTIKDLLNLKYE